MARGDHPPADEPVEITVKVLPAPRTPGGRRPAPQVWLLATDVVRFLQIVAARLERVVEADPEAASLSGIDAQLVLVRQQIGATLGAMANLDMGKSS